MKFTNTRTQQFNVVAEKEFGGNVIGRGYVGSRGAHVVIPNLDRAPAGPGPIQQRRTCFAQLPKVTTIGLFESVADTPSFANPKASLGAPGFGSSRLSVNAAPCTCDGGDRQLVVVPAGGGRSRPSTPRPCPAGLYVAYATREVNRAIEEE